MTIQISRAFDPSKGLQSIENLSGYTFSAESYAHEFVISTPEGFDGAVSARFLRADNITVFVSGSISGIDGSAIVDLPPECYAVPGRFFLSIFVTVDSVKTCIYAGIGTVYRAESDTTIAGDGSLVPLETSIAELLAKYATTINNANLVALFARNIGDIEETVENYNDNYADILAALAEAGVSALNTPNLLTYQPQFYNVQIPSGDVIEQIFTIPAEDETAAAETLTYTFTDETITASHVLHWAKVYDATVLFWRNDVTAACSAGSATITVAARSGAHDAITLTVYLCKVQTVTMPYGELARVYGPGPWLDSISNGDYPGDEEDEIYERGVYLTGDDIITDSDGAVYDTAVAFNVTAAESGYCNADKLVWPSGNSRGVIDAMTDGERYTLSCFARITDGTKAELVFGYGNTEYGYQPYDGGHNREYITVDSTAWKRVWWTFTYHATDSYVPGGGTDPVSVTNYKRVCVGVCRRYTGTVQLAGFRLTAGGLVGSNTVDTLALDVEEAQESVSELQTQASGILASIAPVESGSTASTNYAAGDLLVWKNQLYKASAAITSGATLAVGTNLTATTLAAELAALNA